MSSNQTTCPLCSKVVSWPGLSKHFFGAKHVDEYVVPALLKQKGSLKVWANSTTKSANPTIFVGRDEKALALCFGCHTVKQYLPSYHLSGCKDASKHIDVLKRLLGSGAEQAATAKQAVGECSIALKVEIEKLKTRLEKAEATLETYKRDDMIKEAWMEQVFGLGYDDMYPEQRYDAIDFAKQGKLYQAQNKDTWRSEAVKEENSDWKVLCSEWWEFLE